MPGSMKVFVNAEDLMHKDMKIMPMLHLQPMQNRANNMQENKNMMWGLQECMYLRITV